VVVVTSSQKNNHKWEGGHKVAIEMAGQKLEGKINKDGQDADPVKPYWDYIDSNIGQVNIEKGGEYTLSLRPEAIESAQNLGLTLVEVKLVPVHATHIRW